MAAPRFTLWTPPPAEPQPPSVSVQPHHVGQPIFMPMGGASYGMPASHPDPSRQPLYYHPHHANMVPGYQSPPVPGVAAPVRASPTYMTAPTSQAATNGAVAAAAPQSWPFHHPPRPLQHQHQQQQSQPQHHPQQVWAEGTLVGAPVVKSMPVTSPPGPPPRPPAPQVTLSLPPQQPTTQPLLKMVQPHMMFPAPPLPRPPVGMLPGQYRPVPPGPGQIRCSGWPRHPVPMEAAAAAAAAAAVAASAAAAAASAKASPPAQNSGLYQDLKNWSRTEGLKKKGPSLAGEDGSVSMNKLAKEPAVERFVALLKEYGPQEPSSEQVLNLFLSLTTHERKLVMRAGSIKAFLHDEGVIKLSGNTMVLCDNIPKQYTSEISIEEDVQSEGEEIDEQQLLFEQKASSHGIHISSPPPSQTATNVQSNVYFEEEEVYNPYGQAADSWDPTSGLYSQNRHVMNLEQNVNDIVSWSAEDDQALDDHLREGDQIAENMSGLVNGLQEGSELYSPTLTYANTGMEGHPSNGEQVNETIQRLQREIVFHQELNQMASQLVDKAITQAMLIASTSGDGDKGSDAATGKTDNTKDKETGPSNPLSNSPALSPCPTPSSLSSSPVSKSILNPSLPSFVPKLKLPAAPLTPQADSTLSPTAKVFTPTLTPRNSPSPRNTPSPCFAVLNVTAQVFTPRASPKPPVTSKSTGKVSPLVTDGSAKVKPSETPATVCIHRDSQTLLTTLHRDDKSVGTSRLKRRHVGLQVQVWPACEVAVNTTECLLAKAQTCDKDAMTETLTRNRRLQVGYPRVNIEYRDAATSTDAVEEDDFVDTIDSLQYDEMVARAAAAEETLVLTQAEMHVSEGLRLLKQIETVFMSLPILEQRSIVLEYVQLRENIENQISDNQELAGRNVMAIRDGAWMNTLPVLTWEPPEIPVKLKKTRPHEVATTDGSGDQEKSQRPAQNPTHMTTQQSHVDGAVSDSAPSTRDTSPMPTSASIQQAQQERIRRSSTRSPSISSDHSEPARPQGMVDSAQETAPSTAVQQPESEKPQSTPPATPDAAQMAFLSPLLQSMMISLARMNPALAMQPQLLQATAMQHLMSMQRAGMVPGMAQVPALPSASQGQAQTLTSTATVSQQASAVPHMANPMGASMMSATAMVVPTSVPNAMGAAMSNPMMNPIMAMSGAGSGMNPMQNPGLANQPNQMPGQLTNSMQNDVMPINDNTDINDVITQSQANNTSSSMSLPTRSVSTPSPELLPVEQAPSKPMLDQPVKSTESSILTPAPLQMRQEDLPQQGASGVRKPYSVSKGASQLQEHSVSQTSQVQPAQPVPAKSKAAASVPAPLNTTPQKRTSSASVSQSVVPPVSSKSRTVVSKPVASPRNDPSTDVPLTEDWGDDLEYEGPVFKLDTSSVPKPVKVVSSGARKSASTPPKANHTTSSAAPPSQPVAAAQPPPTRRSATPPTVPQMPTASPVVEEVVWPTLPSSGTEKSKQRKPLPVVASSIRSVPVNQATLTRKPLSSVVAANGSSVSSPAKPTLAEAVKAREAAAAPPKQEGGRYSKHDELDDFESPQYPDYGTSNGRGMAGLSDFGVDDDLFPEPVNDSWQEGSKRKKKGKLKTLTSEDKEDSNFDKLIAQMMSKFPHLSRTEVMKLIVDVRTLRGSLKGVKATEVLSDAHDILKKRASTQSAQEAKYSGQPLLFKTAICEYWKAGTCISGDKCQYAHGKAELRTPPKHIMCSNWKKNRQCPHGDKCIFAHGEKELAKGQQSMGITKKDPKVSGSKALSAAGTASWATVKSKKSTPNMHNMFDDEEEDDAGDGPTCVICRDRISEAWGKTLECGHRFHSNCIMRWIEGEERTCPMCRSHTLLPEDFPTLG